jgi:ribosome-associated protein
MAQLSILSRWAASATGLSGDKRERAMDTHEAGDEDPAELAPGVRALAGGLRVQFARGGGPGGQNVNKLNTKAELWIKMDRIDGLSHAAIERLRHLAGRRLTDADEIHLSEDGHRSQRANRQEIFDRLRQMILAARVEPKRRRKTRPTAGSRRRRLQSKRHRGEIKAQRGANVED